MCYMDKEQLKEGAIGVDYLVSNEKEDGFLEEINRVFWQLQIAARRSREGAG